MGGKGSGRRGGVPYAQNPVRQGQDPRNVDPGTNHAAMVFGKALYRLAGEELDISDPEAVERRFYDFLDLCDENRLRPMVTGLAMALGITRQQLTRVGQGDDHVLSTRLTDSSRAAVKKAYEFMQVSWEINLQNERGNPVKWLFLGKNYYGMRDQTEQVVTHREEPAGLLSEAEVARKYAALVGRSGEPRAIEAEVISVEPVVRGDDGTDS